MSSPRFGFTAGLALSLLLAATASAADYRVFLLAGQSNMDGRAATSSLPTSPVNLQAPQADVRYYNGYSASNGYTNGAWTTLRPGSTQFGPEITFGRTMADSHPAQSIALIKYGHGGTSLAVNWKPGTGADYTGFRNAVTNALTLLSNAGDTYSLAGMLWLQGESDTGANATNYQANLTSFIADMRSNYGADLPFIIGGTGRQYADYPTVVAAQKAVASTIPNVAYFSNDDLLGPSDFLHFDAADQQQIGPRFAAAIESIPEPATLGLLVLAGSASLLRRRHTAPSSLR